MFVRRYLFVKIMFTAIHQLPRVDKQCAKYFATNYTILLAPGVDHSTSQIKGYENRISIVKASHGGTFLLTMLQG